MLLVFFLKLRLCMLINIDLLFLRMKVKSFVIVFFFILGDLLMWMRGVGCGFIGWLSILKVGIGGGKRWEERFGGCCLWYEFIGVLFDFFYVFVLVFSWWCLFGGCGVWVELMMRLGVLVWLGEFFWWGFKIKYYVV